MNLSQLNQLPSELRVAVSSKDLVLGQFLFVQNESADAIFILESGCIQLANYTEDGQQINHYYVKAGESFAEVALFKEHYGCTAIATVPSRVLVIPKLSFLSTIRNHPEIAEVFMMQLAERLHASKLLLELRSIRSAKKRILHYLRLNVQADGFTVQLDHPLKEIADDLGLTPETLSRNLKQLQKEGFLNRRKRKVTLHQEFSKVDCNHGSSAASPLDFKTS